MVIRPSLPVIGEVWTNSAFTASVPAGTSTISSYTSSGLRFHSSTLPLALKRMPLIRLIGPRAAWLPGSHSGNSSRSSRMSAVTGMVCVTR